MQVQKTTSNYFHCLKVMVAVTCQKIIYLHKNRRSGVIHKLKLLLWYDRGGRPGGQKLLMLLYLRDVIYEQPLRPFKCVLFFLTSIL